MKCLGGLNVELNLYYPIIAHSHCQSSMSVAVLAQVVVFVHLPWSFSLSGVFLADLWVSYTSLSWGSLPDYPGFCHLQKKPFAMI